MKMTLLKTLATLAAWGIGASAFALNIVPTFDGSITNDPSGPAMVADINAAIQTFQSNVVDNVTVNILFVNDSNVSLGQSLTWGNDYAYSDFLTALRSQAASDNDAKALSQLPNSSVDPVLGTGTIHLTSALARLLAIDTSPTPDGFDSTIHLNMPLMNFTRPPTNSNNYDLISVVEHEMDEVLGFASALRIGTNVSPIDLFRYTTNLSRTYTTNGDDAYFSVDGTNLVARFNMDSGGDYHDWWSASDLFWSPPGSTPVPQIQDAFGDPGTFQDLGSNELTALDVIGYTLAVQTSTAQPRINIVRSAPGQITLSWPNGSGFVLQERTNLTAGGWSASATGATNPAVILSNATRKFYRLSQLLTPSRAPARSAAVHPAGKTVYSLSTFSLHPR